MKYTVFVMDPYDHYDENPDHLKPGRVVKSITIPERPKATTWWTGAGLWAQGDRGIVTGAVKDASAAVVPAAQVTAIHLATNTKRLEFRWETFNLLNRTISGPLSGATTLQNNNFAKWQAQSNSARRMQVSLKLYW